MEKKNFIEEMKKILKEGKEYRIIPELLQDTLDRLIEKASEQDRKNNIDYNHQSLNYVSPNIMLEKDEKGNYYISYINEEGKILQILDEYIQYKGIGSAVKVPLYKFMNEFERVMKEKEIELATAKKEELDKLFEQVQSGEKTLSEYASYNANVAEQLSKTKSVEEYLDIILKNYAENLGEKQIYTMKCDVAEIPSGKKGPRRKKTPERKEKEEFELENRRKGIESLVTDNEVIEINSGEYYAYIYDLKQNENGESGYMMIVEPQDYYGRATRVICLSEEGNNKLRSENKEKSDIEIKAQYLKDILEDEKKMEEITKVIHKDYGKWMAIINYYLTGSRQIKPEILNIINDDKFKERFPRGYLRNTRKDLFEERE